jgi:hypothetical protein
VIEYVLDGILEMLANLRTATRTQKSIALLLEENKCKKGLGL